MEVRAILYFAGYHDAEESWIGSFSRAVRSELLRLHVQFTELPPNDWLKEYYQLANRIAFLWFLNNEGIRTHLVLSGISTVGEIVLHIYLVEI